MSPHCPPIGSGRDICSALRNALGMCGAAAAVVAGTGACTAGLAIPAGAAAWGGGRMGLRAGEG